VVVMVGVPGEGRGWCHGIRGAGREGAHGFFAESALGAERWVGPNGVGSAGSESEEKATGRGCVAFSEEIPDGSLIGVKSCKEWTVVSDPCKGT
jgi:hypothetical protein